MSLLVVEGEEDGPKTLVAYSRDPPVCKLVVKLPASVGGITWSSLIDEDGTTVAAASLYGVFDLATGRTVASLPGCLLGALPAVKVFVFAEEGEVVLWDVATRATVSCPMLWWHTTVAGPDELWDFHTESTRRRGADTAFTAQTAYSKRHCPTPCL